MKINMMYEMPRFRGICYLKGSNSTTLKLAHEPIVSEEVWELAQAKVVAQAKKYEKVNSPKGEKIHLLSGILKCPICGAGMYGNKSIKHKKDGS